MDHFHKVTHLSDCFIKPRPSKSDESNSKKCYLTPWDIAMLSVHYIQKGLLYNKPSHIEMDTFLTNLKNSLTVTLQHFYPLTGQLETVREENTHRYLVYVNCEKGNGVRFIHAKIDMNVDDVMKATYVSPVVQMFFDHHQCVSYEGHERSLMSIQVTELLDGVFIGCSMNHVLGDGTSYWHFFNMWSEVFQKQAKGAAVAVAAEDDCVSISRPPILDRWFPVGYGPMITLPFNPKQFVSRNYNPPNLVERFFHFSSQSVAKLKAKANTEANTTKISSFQSLSALIWRIITRARNFQSDQPVVCILAANVRARLNPPLSPEYFGNSLFPMKGEATAGELLEHNLGWSAMKLHNAVVSYTDKDARTFLNQWLKDPMVYQMNEMCHSYSIMMGSSPRFDMYGNEFGLGKAVGLRSGFANKFDGKVSSYPGYEGGGSIDLEICLTPDKMKAFECDEELLDAMFW